MGRNNQQRRADKRRRSSARQQGTRPSWEADALSAEVLALEGARASAAGDTYELESACAVLVEMAASAGRKAIGLAVGRTVSSVLASMWEGGWQPVEITREVRRRRGAHAADAMVAAMGAADTWEQAGGAPPPPSWAAQLDQLGVDRRSDTRRDWLEPLALRAGLAWPVAVRLVVDALGALVRLTVIEALLAPPSAWSNAVVAMGRRAPDDPVLAKVRALLAKAESTQFEAESEALTAKAQELMARHAIDDALARADGADNELPITRRLAVDDPYAAAKSYLLQVVAGANGVRCVWYDAFAMMAVIGFEADLDAVEVLFTSLLVQASRAMLAKGSVTDGRGRSRTRSFRQSFLLAFGDRIKERLAAAAASARSQAEEELGTSLLPVLAGRDREVDDAVAAMFPRLSRSMRPTITNEAGWIAGRTAAELATLGPERSRLGTTA